MTEFSDDQLGKRVVAQNGSTVGEVTAIDDGRLVVTVDEDVDPDVVDHMNWDYIGQQETHRLNDRYVSNVDEETIRLRI